MLNETTTIHRTKNKTIILFGHPNFTSGPTLPAPGCFFCETEIDAKKDICPIQVKAVIPATYMPLSIEP